MADLSLKTLKMEGQLYKYTNVMRGYQMRYFVVNNESNRLDYYMSEDVKHQRPRGTIDLQCATISPSEEDSTTFMVYTPGNEVVKLRAQDAKERQYWVNVLRLVVEKAQQDQLTDTESLAKSNSTNNINEAGVGGGGTQHNGRTTQRYDTSYTTSTASMANSSGLAECIDINSSNTKISSYELIREVYSHVKSSQLKLEQLINDLPKKDRHFNRFDKDLLVLKAVARSCVCSIADCCYILNINQKKMIAHY